MFLIKIKSSHCVLSGNFIRFRIWMVFLMFNIANLQAVHLQGKSRPSIQAVEKLVALNQREETALVFHERNSGVLQQDKQNIFKDKNTYELIEPLPNDALVSTLEARPSELEKIDNCIKLPGIDEINGHVIWMESQNVHRDILVKSGATLEISGDITIGFAKHVHIHVERGAILFIHADYGLPHLLSICEETNVNGGRTDFHWGGIRVAGNSFRYHPDFFSLERNPDGEDPGRVIIIHAKITGARVAISDNWLLEPGRNYWGGYVYCDGVQFDKCHRAAEFMRYTRPNKSRFTGCEFRGYRDIQNGPNAFLGMGISAWDCRGIEISGCKFERLDNYALFALDGDFKVNHNNQFKDFKTHAIYAAGSGRLIISDVRLVIGNATSGISNNFINNILDFKIDNYVNRSNAHLIVNNNFTFEQEDIFGNAGIEIVNSFIQIGRNVFDKKYVGISMINTEEQPNRILDNQFIKVHTGIQFIGVNDRSEFLCNYFLGHKYGVYIAPEGTIRTNQGNSIVCSANRWYRTREGDRSIDIHAYHSSALSSTRNNEHETGLFTYHVPDTESVLSIFRPNCNLTNPCKLYENNPFYTTQNAWNYRACNVSALMTDTVYEHSISQLNTLTGDIVEEDVYNDKNTDLLKFSSLKHAQLMDSVHVLIQSAKISSADSLLSLQKEAKYHWFRFSLQLEQEDYAKASDILQQNIATFQDEESMDIAYVQLLNLSWQQDESFRPDSITRVALEDIALKQTSGGGYARALLTWWFDYSWKPYMVDTTEYYLSIDELEEEREASQLILTNTADQLTSIFPNPGNGLYTLQLCPSLTDHIDIKIWKPGKGSPIHSISVSNHDQGTVSIDVQHLPAGMYLLTVSTLEDDTPQVLKFIKL